MTIAELRYGGRNSYPVEFITELPEDKILILIHKNKQDVYIITDIINNTRIPVALITPLCCVDKKVNMESQVPLMSLFDNYKVLSLSHFSDIRKIISSEFYD